MTRERLTLSGLAAVCAVLAAALWLEIRDGGQAGDAQAQRDPAMSRPSLEAPAFNFPPLEAFSEVVERNLFERSRRASGERTEEAGAPAHEPVALTLTGVVITPQTRLALLSDNTPDNVIRLRPGESLGQWVLVEVRRNGVTLRKGTELRELPLDEEQK
jgi:general secretion pathway protein N